MSPRHADYDGAWFIFLYQWFEFSIHVGLLVPRRKHVSALCVVTADSDFLSKETPALATDQAGIDAALPGPSWPVGRLGKLAE